MFRFLSVNIPEFVLRARSRLHHAIPGSGLTHTSQTQAGTGRKGLSNFSPFTAMLLIFLPVIYTSFHHSTSLPGGRMLENVTDKTFITCVWFYELSETQY